MRVEYINPFIESVHHLFDTMMGTQATRGEVVVSKGVPPSRDIVALIGLSGPERGMVAISFPVETALAMVGRMLGVEMRVVDETVRDCVADLMNTIAEGAKSRLAVDGPTVELGLPTVVRGNSYCVDHPSHSAWLEVPFTSELGDFSLRVTFEGSECDRV
jgi:chemotaxis protein CheX